MSAATKRIRIRQFVAVLAVSWLGLLGLLINKTNEAPSDANSSTQRQAMLEFEFESDSFRSTESFSNAIANFESFRGPSLSQAVIDTIPEFPLGRVIQADDRGMAGSEITLCQFGGPPQATQANHFQWQEQGPDAPRQATVAAGSIDGWHETNAPYQNPLDSYQEPTFPYGAGQHGTGQHGVYQHDAYQHGAQPHHLPTHHGNTSHGPIAGYGLPWQAFAQGDFVEPPRQAFSPEYRVRIGDNLTFIYQVIRTQISEPYRLSVGDVISIESDSHEELRQKNLTIMPDGTVSVSPLQSIYVAGMTFIELKAFLQERFAEEGLRSPRITVVPVTIDLPNRDLRDAVDGRAGEGGQRVSVTVTWDGYVWLPKINAVPVVGLSLSEISNEVNARYAAVVPGIEITPVLNTSAPALAYVLGEVGQQGRIEIRRPTTALQAITQAGGQLPGANMRDIIVLRRTSDWRLIATRVNLHESAWGKGVSCDDIWLQDSDIVIVPRSRIERIAELVELYFTRSLYSVLPNQGFVFSYNSNSSIF